MPIFALEKYQEIASSKTEFFKIKKDKKCFFDDFCIQIKREGNKKIVNDLASALRILERFGNGQNLPPKKFKRLKKINGNWLCEAKADDIRIYFYCDTVGNILICGGKKGKQDKDITFTSNLIEEYLGI